MHMQPMNRMPAGYFPPAPTDGMNGTPTGGANPSFNLFSSLQRGNMTPEQRQRRVQDISAMIMGQGPAQNVGQGIGQLMSGVALNIAKRDAAFPQAPGGGQPSFMTGLRNLFSGGNNGGLY
jgi:hypothetical protein